jgi:phosphoribosylamine--glycine ligase
MRAFSAGDVEGICRFAVEHAIDLTVVGPELPLTLGLVDALERRGLRAFGPNAAGARLEEQGVLPSLLEECGWRRRASAYSPSRTGARFRTRIQGEAAVESSSADGLAASKGVSICSSAAEAFDAIDQSLRERAFRDAGSTVVVENFSKAKKRRSLHSQTAGGHPARSLKTTSASSTAIAAPTRAAWVRTRQLRWSREVHDRVLSEVIDPVVAGLRARGIRYQGVLYAGLMIHEGEPRVLEFNARFGDPECQALLVRLESDLVETMMAVAERKLAGHRLRWDPRPSVCVVLAAEGYPGETSKGMRSAASRRCVSGPTARCSAGTAKQNGRVVTAGGRVLGVSALGDTLSQAIANAYGAVGKIRWRVCVPAGYWSARARGQSSVKAKPEVAILMGSDSDWETMSAAPSGSAFGIACDVRPRLTARPNAPPDMPQAPPSAASRSSSAAPAARRLAGASPPKRRCR